MFVPHELETLVPRQVRDVVGIARDEVVQPHYRVPVAQEPVGEVRAEEAGGSRDEDAHQRDRPDRGVREA
jgi:hypothetical protein